jgi:hypothetical protein
MKVQQLKELLTNIPDDLEVYAFNKRIESYGIWNVEGSDGITTEFRLTSFKKRNSFLEKIKFW